MVEQLLPKRTIKDDIIHFVFRWHEFPLDYWWRKRYNIPFGSRQHREMNFIDICVEYQEELLLRRTQEEYEEEQSELEDEAIGLNTSSKEIVKPTAQEIDDDYDNLELSEFDNV